jgi:hypothetical protein
MLARLHPSTVNPFPPLDTPDLVARLWPLSFVGIGSTFNTIQGGRVYNGLSSGPIVTFTKPHLKQSRIFLSCYLNLIDLI